eukprot:12402093-Karenia_brevis.AAC.1
MFDCQITARSHAAVSLIMDTRHQFTLCGAANEAKIKALTMRSVMMMIIVVLITIMVIKLGMMMLIMVV